MAGREILSTITRKHIGEARGKKYEFHTVASRSLSAFDGEITALINKGWILYNKPFSHEGLLCQFVINYKEEINED